MAEQPFDKTWGPLILGFVARSPPGQLRNVITGCRQLTQATIPQDLICHACAEHNEQGLLTLPLGAATGAADGARAIVSEFGRQGNRSASTVPYLCPRTDRIFHVDQERQECTSAAPKPVSNDIRAELASVDDDIAQPFRQALEAELDRYVAAHFPPHELYDRTPAAGAVYSASGSRAEGRVELRVLISSRRGRPRGYWAGAWGSQWRVTFVPGRREPASLGGIIDFATHYAEDGNVHFRRKAMRFAKVAETSDPTEFAVAIVANIRDLEDEFHLATEELCTSFGEGALKEMRRTLPLSKERFDWRPIRHALVRDMKAAGKEGGC